jgi:hypothetical protein
VTEVRHTIASPPLGERIGLAYDRILGDPRRALLVYVGGFSAAMLIGHAGGDLHADILEAYAWGKELQLGYAKHPPFWAWVAHGWFSIFPTSDWAAYLLSGSNAAIGLACTYLIALRLVSERQAMATLLCLMATPVYFCLANRFNANTVLLSLWPATTLFAMRAQASDRIADGVMAGILAAACVLSKYTSVLFLATLLLALPLRSSRAVWVSRSAIAAYASFVLAAAPHALWLYKSGSLPFVYLQVTTARPFWVSAREAVLFPLTSMGFFLPALIIYLTATRRHARVWWRGMWTGWNPERKFTTVLLFCPIFLTIATSIARSATVKPIYVIPMLFLGPIWIAQIPGIRFDGSSLARARRACASVLVFYMAAAPVVGIAGFLASAPFATQPTEEVARRVTQEWIERYDVRLRIVAGDEDYALSAPFYSPHHPSYMLGFDARPLRDFRNPDMREAMSLSPWTSLRDVASHGLAIICSEQHRRSATECRERAQSLFGDVMEELELTAAKNLLGLRGPEYRFRIFFVPPAAWSI